MNEYSREKVQNAVKMAAEDSDEDDLAGWHLDWCLIKHNKINYKKNDRRDIFEWNLPRWRNTEKPLQKVI